MYDVTIIGAGIVGCAAAYELSKYKLSILLVDKENDISEGTTKANSGIVHAGYDPKPDTLMARLNTEGADMIKALCRDLSVPYKQVGSLVIGFDDDDKETLRRLYDNGIKNGVSGMEILDREQILKREPNLSKDVVAALYAPSAAVVSPWELALALAQTAVKNGAQTQLNTEVTAIDTIDGGYCLKTNNGDIISKIVVNAAGVHSDEVADMTGVSRFRITPSKGEYYLLDREQSGLVNSVIFQCPGKNGKGVLIAPTAHGNIIVGPNSAPSEKEDVSTDFDGLKAVGDAAKKSVPSLNLRSNIRNFAGVRANSDADDFSIYQDDKKGIFHLGGIKSPGLSSAPAIARYLADMLRESGVALEEKADFISKRETVRFKELSHEQRAELIKKDGRYGRVVCRCETITEGEIAAALNDTVPPHTIDGVKRRCGTGMGRCQGGFCSPKIHRILAEFYGVSPEEILLDKNGSFILSGRTKDN